ncbi:MAG: acyl-CoA dehydratase activase [Acidaminococcaceae bacterium]|nr:acyl-CoA dehydratase activase [Acidaminococcaceae bacterium]
MSTFNVGLDIGSTTAKMVVLDQNNNLIFSRYKRHQANIMSVIFEFFNALRSQVGSSGLKLNITGSVGMGIAEKYGLPFTQEVISAATFVRTKYPDACTLIDIGGEDAKIVYLHKDGTADLRMNGNCAGGTGAFIDQMALLLDIPIEEMNGLAEKSTHTYSIASRCGVFCKTDIQNLLAKNVSKSDIAASIFHAVAVQTVSTLSHGCTIEPKIILCGGPLSFMPALRKALMDYLNIQYVNFILPDKANLIPAWGTAIMASGTGAMPLDKILA